MSDRVGTQLIETLIGFARERVAIKRIDLGTRGYLILAHDLKIDEPGAMPRIVPSTPVWTRHNEAPSAEMVNRTEIVRVGSSFVLRGPTGPVNIVEVPE